jgi:hypothetical protein
MGGAMSRHRRHGPRRLGWTMAGTTPPDDPGTQRRPRSPLRFFVLVFVLSTPFWLLGAVTSRQLSADLPVSSFIWICPVIAAAILAYRENGTG